MLHFDIAEYQARLERLQKSLAEQGLDGIILFQQESMYWLTGYDTFGFCFFQAMVVTVSGDISLLTRSADYRQAQLTSICKNIRIWKDGTGIHPAQDLKQLLDDKKLAGKRLGFEGESYGLVYANGKAVMNVLDGFVTLQETTRLVDRLRLVKSDAEITYVRRAQELADDAFQAALDRAGPGVNEADVLADMHHAIFSGGGDYPGNEFIIGSGEHALLCRYASGRRVMDKQDQLTLEWAGSYRHYHAAMMQTIPIGQASARHIALHKAASEALDACQEAMVVGAPASDVFHAHARILDSHGLGAHRLNACGYSLGAKFTPSWMDYPMFHAGNDEPIQHNTIFFAHMIIMDSDSGTAMNLGRTFHITDDEAANLSRFDNRLHVIN